MLRDGIRERHLQDTIRVAVPPQAAPGCSHGFTTSTTQDAILSSKHGSVLHCLLSRGFTEKAVDPADRHSLSAASMPVLTSSQYTRRVAVPPPHSSVQTDHFVVRKTKSGQAWVLQACKRHHRLHTTLQVTSTVVDWNCVCVFLRVQALVQSSRSFVRMVETENADCWYLASLQYGTLCRVHAHAISIQLYFPITQPNICRLEIRCLCGPLNLNRISSMNFGAAFMHTFKRKCMVSNGAVKSCWDAS
jgi:hypothetical protein